MKSSSANSEHHYSGRIGWLRACVLGANDGIISTASLILGVAAAHGTPHSIAVAGVAGLVAGSASMAAGEYVSVSSQADTEKADIDTERREIEADFEGERKELADIYVKRGLDSALALQVSDQLMAHNALEAHARDELGITEALTARPIQAALASAITFAGDASLPLIAALLVPKSDLILGTAGASIILLGVLGALAAYTGGANLAKGAFRVVFWGALAMALTAAIGKLFGTSVQ